MHPTGSTIKGCVNALIQIRRYFIVFSKNNRILLNPLHSLGVHIDKRVGE